MEPSSSIDDQQQLGFNQPTQASKIAEPGPDLGYPYGPEPVGYVYPGDFTSHRWEHTRTTQPCPRIEGVEEITASQDFPDEFIVENTTGIEEQRSVLNPKPGFVPQDLRRSSRRSRRRPAAADLRAEVPVAKDTRFKGVLQTKGKYKSEIRIAKRIQQEKRSTITKVWLGTFDTQVQADRALDVGKYFFKAGIQKNYFDPKIEDLLSTISQQQLQQLQAEPLKVLVDSVKEIAYHYAIHGTLPSSNLSISTVEM